MTAFITIVLLVLLTAALGLILKESATRKAAKALEDLHASILANPRALAEVWLDEGYPITISVRMPDCERVPLADLTGLDAFEKFQQLQGLAPQAVFWIVHGGMATQINPETNQRVAGRAPQPFPGAGAGAPSGGDAPQ